MRIKTMDNLTDIYLKKIDITNKIKVCNNNNETLEKLRTELAWLQESESQLIEDIEEDL